MTITNHNGSITLTSFAELGSVIDPETLPSAPAEDVEVEAEAAGHAGHQSRTNPRAGRGAVASAALVARARHR
jgi:hypothetical protein